MQFRGCKTWQQAGPLQTRQAEKSRSTSCSESSRTGSSSLRALPSFSGELSDRNPNGLLRQSFLPPGGVTSGVLLTQAGVVECENQWRDAFLKLDLVGENFFGRGRTCAVGSYNHRSTEFHQITRNHSSRRVLPHCR